MQKISVCMICARREEFIDLSIASVIDWCDEIVIVGDPDDFTKELIFKHPYSLKKVKLVYRIWDGDYGAARTHALEYAHNLWILQLDADEIIGDTAYLFDTYMKSECDTYSMKYRHFIRTFTLEDNTFPEHIGINRFFKKEGATYNRAVHEYAESTKWKKEGIIRDIMIWHLGYLKGVVTIQDKYTMNKEKSTIHDKEFIKDWHDAHLLGQYPVRAIALEELPRLIRERFEI